jgi:hypothetical protein
VYAEEQAFGDRQWFDRLLSGNATNYRRNNTRLVSSNDRYRDCPFHRLLLNGCGFCRFRNSPAAPRLWGFARQETFNLSQGRGKWFSRLTRPRPVAAPPPFLWAPTDKLTHSSRLRPPPYRHSQKTHCHPFPIPNAWPMWRGADDGCAAMACDPVFSVAPG